MTEKTTIKGASEVLLEDSIEEKTENKARTPSGNTISVKFGDIRAIFSPSRYKVSERASTKSLKTNQPLQQRLRATRSNNSISLAGTSSIVKVVKRKSRRLNNQLFEEENQQDTLFTSKRLYSDSEGENYFTPPGTPTIKKPVKRPKPHVSQTEKKMPNQLDQTLLKEPQVKEASHSAEEPANHIQPDIEMQTDQEMMPTEKVKALNLELVMSMFNQLKSRLDKIEEKFPAEASGNEIPDIDRKIDNKVSDYEAKVEECQTEIKALRVKNYQISCAHQLTLNRIDDLEKRMSKLELNDNRKTVAITGLFVYSESKEDIGREIDDFFQSQLKINVKINDVFFVGTNNPPTCVVSLATLQDKREIMSCKSMLKDVLNKEEQPIYINDYWTAEANERRKVERELVDINSKFPENRQKVVDYQGPNLLLDGKKWTFSKKISTPYCRGRSESHTGAAVNSA